MAAGVWKNPEKEVFMKFHETQLDAAERKEHSFAANTAFADAPEPQFLWRFRHGVFWNPDQLISPMRSQCMRIPIADFPDFALDQSGEGWKRLRKKYKDQGTRTVTFSFSFYLGPLTVPQEVRYPFGEDNIEKNQLTGQIFSFDCLPVSATDLLLFLLHHSQLTIWHGKGKPVPNTTTIDVEWTKGETIPAGFQEHFRTEGDSENYYFVTRSGRVFASLKPAAGRGRRVEVLWSDTTRPVRTLIADANTGRTFVFAPAPRVEEPQPPLAPDEPRPDPSVYFELTPDFPRREYDPAKLPANKLTGRIKTVVSHVDFLIDKKQIVLPAPKR
jgi:hypothetical protein